jgi:hypothetical protein
MYLKSELHFVKATVQEAGEKALKGFIDGFVMYMELTAMYCSRIVMK